MATKHYGKPPKYSSPEQLQAAIDKYFRDCDGTPYLDADGNPVTKHSTALVPLCHICNEPVPFKESTGKLADIAPTLLTLMGLEVPEGMEGTVLV